jgi:hypothetical protein
MNFFIYVRKLGENYTFEVFFVILLLKIYDNSL